ncbi:MAG TPA: type III-B CRISPR-associated protein Cas10/Cmr2 [Candidatus Tenderia sp.]|nr:type III-B CRISPR-associated protein Cas10/Cmr2 [Candidatus Tenderia sp.]
MSYLFLCSIGPVQDFIAAARSSRDLAYGSWLLSELAKTAARTVAEEEGFEALVFPAPASKDDLRPNSNLSVANKVVAVLEGDPASVAQSVQQALHEYVEQAWQPIENKLGNKVDADLARWQLDDLLEIYWAAEPLSSPDDYKAVRDRCEQALNARKATRDFAPHQGASRFKSSIDGVREHVLALVPDTIAAPNTDQMQEYKLRNGELLSGVDLLKRWKGLRLSNRYKSTSHMAALPFAEGLDQEDQGRAEELCRKLVRLIKDEGGNLFVEDDYGVFYPSEVRAAFSTKEKKNREKIKKVLQEQERILTEYAGQRRPSPYYALLQADGDSMGKAIDAQVNQADHRRLSQQLSEFAQKVPKIVQDHKGVPVYAGGDDVLAYLPLHTALNCVHELADTFATTMKNFVFEDEHGNKHSPTLSTGLVITHHLEPLRDVLELVRSAEKSAKGITGKNALAVTLNKRSGVERTVKGNRSALIERLQKMVQWWLDGTLSKGTAYELERLAREMEGVLKKEALQAEAVRILKRKRESGGEEGVSKDVIDTFQAWIKKDKEKDKENEDAGNKENKGIPLHELAQEMIVANEFAKAVQQAQGKEA